MLASLNEDLSSGGDVTPETARRMGLLVVSRLAKRHGITVSLARNVRGGTTATVLLPASVLQDRRARPPAKSRPGMAGLKSAKDVLRPFSRVMLKLVSTGNQLAPDMINPSHFADWGPNISKVDAPLKLLRKAIPMATLNTTETAWEVNLKTSVELYTIWEMTGVLDQLEGIDQNLFDVISDIMDEKREDWKDYLEDQEDADDE